MLHFPKSEQKVKDSQQMKIWTPLPPVQKYPDTLFQLCYYVSFWLDEHFHVEDVTSIVIQYCIPGKKEIQQDNRIKM